MMVDALTIIGIATIMLSVAYIVEATKDKRSTKCYLSRERELHAKDGKCHGVMGGDRWSDYLSYACMDCKYFVYPDIKGRGDEDE